MVMTSSGMLASLHPEGVHVIGMGLSAQLDSESFRSVAVSWRYAPPRSSSLAHSFTALMLTIIYPGWILGLVPVEIQELN